MIALKYEQNEKRGKDMFDEEQLSKLNARIADTQEWLEQAMLLATKCHNELQALQIEVEEIYVALGADNIE